MAKKEFDLKKKTITAAPESDPAPTGPQMILHEEAKPLGFWGKLKMSLRLGITWKDIIIYILLAVIAFGLAVLVTRWLASRQQRQIASQPEGAAEAELPPLQDQTNEPSPASPAGGPTAEPKAAATPTVDKTSLKIRVLNGNGISGDAKKLAALLTEAGFQTGGVANAQGVYQTTQVWYLATKQPEAEAVAAELTKAGKEVETKEAEQAVIGSGYQILVVTGVK